MSEPRRWTLRRRIGQTFAGVAAVLTVLVAAVVVSAVAFVRVGNSAVYRWQPAALHTQQVLTDLVDQETGLRGYALSRDPSFLDPYDQQRSAEATDAARLAQLLRGDAALSRLLARLEQAVTQWEDTVVTPAVAGLRAGGSAADRAVALVEGATARQLFDQLRTRVGELSAAVSVKAAHARSERVSAGVAFLAATAVTAVVLAATAAFVWRGLHRWVLAPVDRLGAQTREVAAGATFRQIVPGGPAEFVTLGHDVEAMRLQIAGELARAEEIQDELRRQGAELARSNADLQQFAYVASHDLSEPLRKVANFCQLLERQYGPRLDDQARQYIHYAVDGAKRMQTLIGDLLALSRVGRSDEKFVPVSLDSALDSALANLSDRLDAAGAHVVRRTPLPTVAGDRSLLVSLLENLVGNAVKYRREDVAPHVTIAAELDAERHVWTLSVSDNGIGIEAQYAERIFAVFQRLHLREQYEGTGIGLALCRRIVEFHGGRIWLAPVESSPGATFRFTLPEGGAGARPRP